ncbi:MAG: hypothetical protein SFY96_08100 [Planctomycetota bacterium]|nr:hypothetical protein [Planctomycetota bacterium]
MNTHELLEAAQLDALGLLDESERDAFESAFASAHPSIKAQIRLEQARLCRLEGVWPDIRPSASLKDRVLDAVRAAKGAKVGAAEAKAHVAGRLVPPISASHRVSPLWRASALGFATAAAVFAVMLFSIQTESNKLQRTVAADTFYGRLSSLVGEANLRDIVFNPNTRRVVFNAPAARVPGRSYSGEAVLYVNADREKTTLVATNLNIGDNESLRVCVVDDEGKVIEQVKEVGTAGAVLAEDVNVNTRDLAAKGLRLALVAAVRGTQAASGTVLMTSSPFAA